MSYSHIKALLLAFMAILGTASCAVTPTFRQALDSSTCTSRSVGAISENLQLIATYSWGPDQRDLDTATSFLDGRVGFSCGSSPNTYITFSGDSRGADGSETATMFVGRAFQDGAWTISTSVVFEAQWFGSEDMGPATLTLSVLDPDNGNSEPINTIEITPGVGRECSMTIVATAIVEADGTVTLIKAVDC